MIEVAAETKVTEKFQITLPKEPREKIGVRRGDTVAVYAEGDHLHVFVKPRTPEEYLERMAKLSGGRRFIGFSKEFRKDRKEW